MELSRSAGNRIGFSFSSDWMKEWRESFKPIVKRKNAKPIGFHTQKKTALFIYLTDTVVLWTL